MRALELLSNSVRADKWQESFVQRGPMLWLRAAILLQELLPGEHRLGEWDVEKAVGYRLRYADRGFNAGSAPPGNRGSREYQSSRDEQPISRVTHQLPSDP